MNTGILIWTVALAGLLFYIVRLALEQPKGFRLPLLTYWLLFILSPLVIFAFMMTFSVPALMIGFVLLIVLAIIGEHGFRRWKRLFKTSDEPDA